MQRWRFETAYAHPSLLSVVAAVGAIGIAARAKDRITTKEGMLILWLIATTVLTVSRTAIFGMVLGLGIVALSRRSLAIWLCLILVPASALMVSSDVRKGIGHYLARGQTSSELASLTGRSYLYRVALNRIDRSLPWGEGFQSGRLDPLEEDNATMVHAHNLLLEATAGMGILGGLAVVLIVLTWLMNLTRLLTRSGISESDATSWELCAISVPLLAFCVLDSGFVNAINALVFVYLAVITRTELEVVDSVEGATDGAGRAEYSASPAVTTG
jgi:O-antigen ligase